MTLSTKVFVEHRLQMAADELRTWNGVAIVGAGVSFMAGLPLTHNLDPLLWQAVDSDEEALSRLADRLGCQPAAAKSMIADNPHARQSAFEIISACSHAREAFQRGFSLLDKERARAHSRAHDALARLLHRRHLETVISLNWDTLLEAAYLRLYGSPLAPESSWLWKPHGDAAHPERCWVFPYENSLLPPELIQHLNLLTEDRPRTLLIAGYSERDESILRQIIGPLAESWRVVRLSPHAQGEFDIPLVADEALPELLHRINPRPETPGWEYVSFEPHSDLRPALLGRRLGPNEVEVCPRLPEVGELTHLLELAHSAILVGDSGCGKSITAYQAAYDLSRSRFEPLRLIHLDGDPDEILSSLTNLSRPTVTILDDAQAVDPGLIRRLLEKATAQLKVLVVSTDDYSFQRASVSLHAERAVKILADHLLSHRQETLEIVRQLDDHVGENYLNIAIEDRIKEASESSTPWQFSFVLTGGWRRTQELLMRLRRSQRADHLLTAVAVHQLLSEDSGATLGQLTSAAFLLGHDHEWMRRALDTLSEHRLVLGEERFRCPHARFAEVVLREVADSEPNESEFIGEFIRSIIVRDLPPLLGIVRVLRGLRFTDRFYIYRSRQAIVDGRVLHHLMDRCWAASTNQARGSAAYLLESLEDWHPNGILQIEANAKILGNWLEEVEAESAGGLEYLLRDLSQQAKAVSETICGYADPQRVAYRMARAKVNEGHVWGQLLCVLARSASSSWGDIFRASLPYETFLGLADEASMDDVFYIGELAQGLMRYNSGVALEMIERVAPKIARRINLDPPNAFEEFHDIFWHVLGYFPRFLARRTPTRQQRMAAQTIARYLQPEKIAAALSRTSKRDITNFARLLDVLWETSRREARAIVKRVDVKVLSDSTRDLWVKPGKDLEHLLGMLAQTPDRQPALSLIQRNAAKLERFTPTLAIISPEMAITALRAGVPLPLEVDDGFRWNRAAFVLNEVSKRDRGLANELVHSNAAAIARGLELRQSNQCEHLDVFILVLCEVAPEEFSAVLSELSPVVAEANWSARLRDGAAQRRAVAWLIAAASQVEGPIADVARRLQQRFPAIIGLAQRAKEQPLKRRRRSAKGRQRSAKTK
jgi:hypothetical protein